MPARLKTNVQSALLSSWINNHSNVYHLPFFFCKFFLHNETDAIPTDEYVVVSHTKPFRPKNAVKN